MGMILIQQMWMPQLERERTIRMYLPPDYHTASTRYPVIYMHDAQNLYDPETASYGSCWQVSETLDRFYHEKKNEGVIVVGIDNSSDIRRYDEYSPWRTGRVRELKDMKDTPDLGGDGDKYGAFIVETLKPWVDQHFRTLPGRDTTAVIGSSMGGFISLYLGLRYQDVFSKIGALSTASWFADGEMDAFILATGKHAPMRIYLDVGTNETSNANNPAFPGIYLKNSQDAYANLLKSGFSQDELKLVVEEGAVHNEEAWARRFPGAMEWLGV